MIGRGPGHPRHDAAARGQPSDESASQASGGRVAALTIAALGIVYADIRTSPLGLHPYLFASIADFLTSEPPDSPTCLVLDVRLPGRSGLDFQRDLAAASVRLPIVFITGHGDIPMTVQAMKAGAIEFLTKPFRDQDLLDAVNVGLARDRARREDEQAVGALRARIEELTPRERAILTQVVEGRLNKQIAGDMGITETTVKVHRSNMMRKIKAASVAELCRMVDRLNLPPGNSKPS